MQHTEDLGFRLPKVGKNVFFELEVKMTITKTQPPLPLPARTNPFNEHVEKQEKPGHGKHPACLDILNPNLNKNAQTLTNHSTAEALVYDEEGHQLQSLGSSPFLTVAWLDLPAL